MLRRQLGDIWCAPRGVGERELHIGDSRGQDGRRRHCVVGRVHLPVTCGEVENTFVESAISENPVMKVAAAGLMPRFPVMPKLALWKSALCENRVVRGSSKIHRIPGGHGTRATRAGDATCASSTAPLVVPPVLVVPPTLVVPPALVVPP